MLFIYIDTIAEGKKEVETVSHQTITPPPSPDKVKRDVTVSDYKNGGLRMIDIKSFNKALKPT